MFFYCLPPGFCIKKHLYWLAATLWERQSIVFFCPTEVSLFMFIGWIGGALDGAPHGCTFILRGVVPIIKNIKKQGQDMALLAMRCGNFIFLCIYYVLRRRGPGYFSVIDPKSTKVHETLGISPITIQTDLPNS